MSQNRPKVSVIIPVYNGEKIISECINSLKKQTFREKYEIIIVDDGSTDNTAKIVKKIKGVVFLKQKHKGPAVARNFGAKKVRSEILLFTDADCIVEKDWIKQMIEPFKKKEIIGVQGSYKTKQKSVVARFAQLEIEERYERMKSKKYIDFIGSYSAGYRKNIFLKSGGFDESFPMASGEDPELSFKLAESGHKMVFTTKAIVYHKHPSNLGKYLKQKFWRAYWRILLYKKHPGKIKSESYTPQTLKLQIGILYLFFLFLIGSLFSRFYLNVSALLILVLFLSTIGLSYKNLKKDILVGLYSPVIVVLRTVSFGLGLLYGFLRLVV